jgi:DNA-binding protein Fis
MNQFISKSKETKNILESALLAINLPVNIVILGESGLGKKLLTKEIIKDVQSFDASLLEELINTKKINLSHYSSLIVYDLHNVINKNEFLFNCKDLKIIATALCDCIEYSSSFAVKIQIPKLNTTSEDFKYITQEYIKEASILSDNKDINMKHIKYDLSQNGISLKKSIFKSIFNSSLEKNDFLKSFEDFLEQEVKKDKTYKELLSLFEIPLLNASKKAFKSQLKISSQLGINRITLRKKLDYYFGA